MKWVVYFSLLRFSSYFFSSLSVYLKDFEVLLFSIYSAKTTMDWPLILKLLYCVIWEDSENQTQ